MGQVLLPNGTAQPNPPSGYTAFYAKTDGGLYYKTAAGVESPVGMDAVNPGYFDLKPISLKDDGANGWSVTTVNGFPVLTATSTNALKQLVATYHADHDISLALSSSTVDGFFHLHWSHATVAPTGNFVIDVKVRASLPNGAFTTLTPLQFVVTPTAGNINLNNITEMAMPMGWYPYMTPDAILTVLIERNRGANATDTFANSVLFHSADFHVLGSSRLTTNKDIGTGWVNT